MTRNKLLLGCGLSLIPFLLSASNALAATSTLR